MIYIYIYILQYRTHVCASHRSIEASIVTTAVGTLYIERIALSLSLSLSLSLFLSVARSLSLFHDRSKPSLKVQHVCTHLGHSLRNNNAFEVPLFDPVEVPRDRAPVFFVCRQGIGCNHNLLHIKVLCKQDDADGASTAPQGLLGVSREAPEIEFGTSS